MSDTPQTWHVWIHSREITGAPSYIYPFGHVPGDSAEDAIDYVLNHYCATRDGRRFLIEGSVLAQAQATPMDQVTEVTLKAIDQPQYQRDIHIRP